MRRHPAREACNRSIRSIARGRAEREPQAAVAREALLGCEVVDVERRRVDPHPARGGRPVDDDERVARPAGATDDHAGRGLVVRIGVDVALDRDRGTRRSPGSVSHTCGSSRWGAALVTCANFDENSPITKWVLRRSTSPNDRRVPEQRRAAVADQHLVSVGEREQLGQTVPDAVHHGADAVFAMARAEEAGRRVGERGNRLVGNLRRTGAEPPIGRPEVGGDLDHGTIRWSVLTGSR